MRKFSVKGSTPGRGGTEQNYTHTIIVKKKYEVYFMFTFPHIQRCIQIFVPSVYKFRHSCTVAFLSKGC
jgi:hypothetical protein